ncbi:MAG: hypothetical protein ACIAQZ_08920 [Sedimentisphaeraceae bacterium JB056]
MSQKSRIVSISLAAILASAIIITISSSKMRLPIAKERNNNPSPSKFTVALFPNSPHINIDRAILVNLKELEQEKISIFVNNQEKEFPRNYFTAIPDKDSPKYIGTLNKEIANWGSQTDWKSIEYHQANTSEKTKAALIIIDKAGNTREFIYNISASGTIEPDYIDSTINKVKNLAN